MTISEYKEKSGLIGSDIKKKLVVFVCTGNTCRSPMCSAYFNSKYKGKGMYSVSRGLYANGSLISEYASEALKEDGIVSTADNNYIDHISRTVSEKDIETADEVVAVSSSHAFELILRFPAYASKIKQLPHSISDPFGGDLDDYRSCLSDIKEAVTEMYGE